MNKFLGKKKEELASCLFASGSFGESQQQKNTGSTD